MTTCTTCGAPILYRPDEQPPALLEVDVIDFEECWRLLCRLDERTECARCSGLGPLIHRGGELVDRGGRWLERDGGELVHLGMALEEIERPKARERRAEGQALGRETRWSVGSGSVEPEPSKPSHERKNA